MIFSYFCFHQELERQDLLKEEAENEKIKKFVKAKRVFIS